MGVEKDKLLEQHDDLGFITAPPSKEIPELGILPTNSFLKVVGGPIRKISFLKASRTLEEKLNVDIQSSKRVSEGNLDAPPGSIEAGFREDAFIHEQACELILQDLQNGDVASGIAYLKTEMLYNFAALARAEDSGATNHPLIDTSRDIVRTDIAVMVALQGDTGV